MKYILRMAKSCQDLKGAKGPKLELDYLRLVYAVDDLRRNNKNAQGYLVVLTQQIAERVKRWENKYGWKDSVKIICVSLSSSINNRLNREKKNNISGMVAGSTGRKVGGRSSANFGRLTGEVALKDRILELEPGVKEIKNENEFPCLVRWDFYGTIG